MTDQQVPGTLSRDDNPKIEREREKRNLYASILSEIQNTEEPREIPENMIDPSVCLTLKIRTSSTLKIVDWEI